MKEFDWCNDNMRDLKKEVDNWVNTEDLKQIIDQINQNKEAGDKWHKRFKENLEKTLEGIYDRCNEVEEGANSNKLEIIKS